MSERNVARDISNEILIWGTAGAIMSHFNKKKQDAYKDWFFRKSREIARKLTPEQNERLLEFFKDEDATEFVYRAKTAEDFSLRYTEATGRKLSEDGLEPNDLFYDPKFVKSNSDSKPDVEEEPKLKWSEWPLKKKITTLSIVGVVLLFIIIGAITSANDEKNKPKLADINISGYYDGIYKIDNNHSSELRLELSDFDNDSNTGNFKTELYNDLGFWTTESYGTFTINYDNNRIYFNGYIKLVNGSERTFSGDSGIMIRGSEKNGYEISFQLDQNGWLYTFSKDIVD